ncbi:hypothetical protein N7535_008314 [Penicillium sp. DV-2018c]|nr:hypothetical protein N7535_008314 [Penicillium sp. DV-2018c]
MPKGYTAKANEEDDGDDDGDSINPEKWMGRNAVLQAAHSSQVAETFRLSSSGWHLLLRFVSAPGLGRFPPWEEAEIGRSEPGWQLRVAADKIDQEVLTAQVNVARRDLRKVQWNSLSLSLSLLANMEWSPPRTKETRNTKTNTKMLTRGPDSRGRQEDHDHHEESIQEKQKQETEEIPTYDFLSPMPSGWEE